jgi:uncharacterized membrane protein SpoIIM required for sporulation
MRETSFIKQNEEKWREFESVMDNPKKDPEKLNDLFVQITDDLSFSRTFYPNRSVRVYLNGLAQRIFFSIYKNRRSHSRRLLTFWTRELPRLVYESRRAFRTSFFVFAVAFLIGVVSSAMDPDFAAVILGDSYVEMTMENINSGDPMAVYKQKGAFGMSLGITFNNLWVAFLTFVMGAFFTIGSIAVLIRNGIMVGAFQFFFIERDLFWESFLTIWIHGTLEISAIIIAGAAGITLGRGLAFPGTYSRAQAFQRSARRGLKLMVGIAPIIIMAGFIEGYLTRHTDTPDIIRGLFIAVCLIFVLVYFVWYPWYLARRGFPGSSAVHSMTPNPERHIDFSSVKSSGEIFADLFVIYRKYFGRLFLIALGSTILFTSLVFILGSTPIEERFYYPTMLWDMIHAKRLFFVNEQVPLLGLINAIVFTLIAYTAFRFIRSEEQPDKVVSRKQLLLGLVNVLVPMAVLQLVLQTDSWYTPYLTLGVLPLVCLWAYAGVKEQLLLPGALIRAFALAREAAGTVFGLFAILLILGFLFTALADTALASLFIDMLTWVVHLEGAAMDRFSTVALTFVSAFLLHLSLVMLFLGGGLLYYALAEIKDAGSLKARIKDIGVSRRIQGIERE